jgi:hypothetical protein
MAAPATNLVILNSVAVWKVADMLLTATDEEVAEVLKQIALEVEVLTQPPSNL